MRKKALEIRKKKKSERKKTAMHRIYKYMYQPMGSDQIEMLKKNTYIQQKIN